MNLELALILGFLFHSLGDYILQNDWMALNKTKSFFPALIHALVYSLPFLIITGFGIQWLIIFITHFLIDRYRLAMYWIRLVNLKLLNSFQLILNQDIYQKNDIISDRHDINMKVISKITQEKHTLYTVTNHMEGTIWWKFIFPNKLNGGYWSSKPQWMAIWLMIIIDNVFHILINSLCIYLTF